MTRGTTPLHTFTFPEQVSNYRNIVITYRQNNELKLSKGLDDLDLEENTAKLRLTTEETLLFDPMEKGFVQVKVLTQDNLVEASPVYSFSVNSILDETSIVPVNI